MLPVLVITASAQPYPVTVTIAVAPPYTSKIDDYISQPNKVMATFINTSSMARQVYVRGVITGEGGIRVMTDPAWKPSQPLTLQPGIPFRMNRYNIEQVFNADHLLYQGISKNEILYGNGLPEGDYTICMQAFDFGTNQSLSAEEPLGCSAIFKVSDLEPPVVIRPDCGDTIFVSTPQNLLINWTRPPNCPINTQFNIKVIEVLPGDRNINDAMRSAIHPVFFEKTINVSSYVYSAADPALVPGKKYAFAITAIDPAGKANFRNKGMSEVCWFVYRNKSTGYQVDPGLTFEVKPNAFPPQIIPNRVQGVLKYRYAESGETKTWPLAGVSVSLQIRYLEIQHGTSLSTGGWFPTTTTPSKPGLPQCGTVLATAKTKTDGSFDFSYFGSYNFGKVVAGTGEMGKDYWMVAMVLIGAPHSAFYMGPNEYFMPAQGEQIAAGQLISLVKSYELDVIVKPRPTGNDVLDQSIGTDKLSSINVYICRKPDFAYQLFPMEDVRLFGQAWKKPDDADKYKVPGMIVMAKGVTGVDGLIKFQRMVWNHLSAYTYYLWADSDAESDQNFSFGAPVPFNPQLPPSISTIDLAEMEVNKLYELQKYAIQTKTLLMDPTLPLVAGKVLEGSPGEAPLPLKGVKVHLGEMYQLYQNKPSLVLISTGNDPQKNQAILNCIQSPPCQSHSTGYTSFSPNDGSFGFYDLSMIFNTTDKKVTGPNRTLVLKKEGYNDLVVDILPLAYGKKTIRNNLLMTKGAKIGGRVVDAESGAPLQAWIHFAGQSKHHCGANGVFSQVPAMLLPNQQQHLIIEMNGYLTDTVQVVINKKGQYLGDLKIYTIKRRLKVLVCDATKSTLEFPVPIQGAHVRILNVTTNINGQLYPIGDFTGPDGIVEFSFVNGGNDNNKIFELRIGMPDNTSKNYEQRFYSIKIPYSSNPVYLKSLLKPAACIKGHVYAGTGTTLQVGIASITLKTGSQQTELSATSSANGYYYLNNVPVRPYFQLMTAAKPSSNLVGDEQVIHVAKASDQCLDKDFHLTVFNDMDITKLLGFPIEVTALKDTLGVKTMSGNMLQIPANDQFAMTSSINSKIPFTNVAIQAGTVKNDKGIPIAVPVASSVRTDAQSLKVTVYSEYDGELRDNTNGIRLEKNSVNQAIGEIRGPVKVTGGGFNTYGITLPDLWLAKSASTGTDKMKVNVFTADAAIKMPNALPEGFFLCNDKGGAFRYGFTGFSNPPAAEADMAKSHMKPAAVMMHTILHTACNNVNIAGGDLKLNLGAVEVKKTGYKVNPGGLITFMLDKWKLDCNNWVLNDGGLTMNKSVVKAGLDVPVDNLVLTYATLDATKATAQFGDLMILGTQPVKVTTTNKGMCWYDSGNGAMKWQIYAANDGNGSVAYLEGLPGFNGQKLEFTLIRMVNDGSRTFAPAAKLIKLYNILDFIPDLGTSMNIYENATPPFMKVQGVYMPHLPYIDQFKGNLAYEKQGTGFKFRFDNAYPINFTHNNMQFVWNLNTLALSNQLFTAKGTAEEQAKLLPVNITMTQTPNLAKIEIDPNQKILITQNGTKYLKEVTGGMLVEGDHWNKFWFEGAMVGMTGISDNPSNSRVKFICNGDISADGQSINVNKLDAFPGMNFTYDFPNSRFIGSLNINKDLSGMQASGTATCLFDPNGWYIKVEGTLDITGIGGCGLFGLFGDYSDVPPDLTVQYGAVKCIPPAFQGSVRGFLLQGSITKQLIPSIEWGVTLPVIDKFIGVELNADVSMFARLWMTFDPNVNTYGMAMLAEGNINGGVSTGTIDLSAFANAQLGIAGTYHSDGYYHLIGCASLALGVSASVFVGIDWIDVSLASPDVGLKMDIDRNTGMSFGLKLGSCAENMCP
jgi:TANFOR domain-containing protein